nr:hypothetical protein GCM10020093_103790 [Planobispora longispora]
MLVETPAYPGALASARAAGLRATAVPMDRDGVRPELLAEAFAVTGARVFLCQPTLHNPTGATLTRERREQVLAVARAAGRSSSRTTTPATSRPRPSRRRSSHSTPTAPWSTSTP